MPLIKDKYKGDHYRSKYLRNNQVIKNPQVESQYQTTDQKLVAESKNIQKTTTNVVGTQSLTGYSLPANSLTSIGSINPAEVLNYINVSYSGSGTDPVVSLLWSVAKPSDITSTVSTGVVSITKGNVFAIDVIVLGLSSRLVGGVVLNDFIIANPKKTIYLYAASSQSTVQVTVVKNKHNSSNTNNEEDLTPSIIKE